MNVKGYEIKGEWKVSNIGHTAIGYKGGKKYFLKRYGEYKMPIRNESMTDALYRKLEKEFRAFQENRVAINRALADLAGPGGNIILPADWFVDEVYYVEATEFIDGMIEDKEILKLPMENKLFLMLTAAGALFNVHRKNIVHGDLKRTNILAARNSAGRTVAKIIDFDRSYFADKIQVDELGGDQNFMSPELMQCFMCDMADEALAYLSTKSDIYSLGLVFHDYLAGDHPTICKLTGGLLKRATEGKTVYCGEAALSGAELVISDKIKDEYLSHLLAAMLQPEPEDRPTAQEVLEVLKTKRVLPIRPDSLVKCDMPAAKEEKTVTPTKGKTATAAEGYCEPWEEHKILLCEDKMAKSGYRAAARYSSGTSHCYRLIKADGSSRIFTKENLLLCGLAVRETEPKKTETPPSVRTEKPAATPADMEEYDDGTLWDSGYRFAIDQVKAYGYQTIAKAIKKGVRGYVLTKNNGEKRFMSLQTLLLLRFIVKE